jgi:hypothetical protein
MSSNDFFEQHFRCIERALVPKENDVKRKKKKNFKKQNDWKFLI